MAGNGADRDRNRNGIERSGRFRTVSGIHLRVNPTRGVRRCACCAPMASIHVTTQRADCMSLELLALIEHPDALPHSAALRLSREIMAIIDLRADRLRCDPVTPDHATGEDP